MLGFNGEIYSGVGDGDGRLAFLLEIRRASRGGRIAVVVYLWRHFDFLVCFAGIMSGLTLGLMSLGLMDLEVLQRSGLLLSKNEQVLIHVSKHFFIIFFTTFRRQVCILSLLDFNRDKGIDYMRFRPGRKQSNFIS